MNLQESSSTERSLQDAGATPSEYQVSNTALSHARSFDTLKIAMLAMIFYLPNQAQFGLEFSLRGLNVVNIIFLIIFFALRRSAIAPAGSPTPLKGVFAFFFISLLWAFAMGLVNDPSEWVNDLTILKNAVFYMLLYFLFFHSVDDIRTVRMLVAFIAFVTFTSVVLGFRQALDYGIGNYNETRRVAAPFGWGVFNANRSAIYFCIYLPLLMSIALFYKSRPLLRAACFAVFALGVFVVFHTYSRQSYFIMAVVLMCMTMRKNFLVTALLCLALLNYEYWVPESVVQRIEMTSSSDESKPIDPSGEEQKYDDSTASRFIFWEAAWEMLQDNPLGIGLNHFKREVGKYVPARYAGMDAHNFYVLFTAEGGMFSPLSIVAMLWGLASLNRKLLRLPPNEDSRTLGIAYSAALIAVILGNIYGSRFLDGDVMGNFWILTALVAKYTLLRQKELSSTGTNLT